MPELNLPEWAILLEKLRRIYRKAEDDILDAISYKRTYGLIDYAEVAALERVQRILAQLQDDCWRYVPRLVESHFYAAHPERAWLLEPVAKHTAGYLNAAVLTTEQTSVVSSLTANLMGEVIQASKTAQLSARTAIGRLHDDVYRRVGLETVASMETRGVGVWKSARQMETALRAEGVTAFTDKAGRKWSLSGYCIMATRTTSRQAQILSVLTTDPEQDLFQITSHGTTCPVCAPLEGRVYSKSGQNPDYPPLAAAFGKVDKEGPDTLVNTYLNIHPNCLHAIRAYSTVGLSEQEIERDRRFSSFKTNPPAKDPRNAEQIKKYRDQQRGRRQLLSTLKEYERYRAVLGDRMPKTVETFLKHKLAKDDKYKQWRALYRRLT